MKKYLLIALFMSITFTIQAQQTEFSIVGGGLGSTAQKDFLGQTFNTGKGYYLGLGSEFSLTKRSSIYSELTYGNINGSDYFQLPILYKYRFARRISVLAGFQIGYIAEENIRDVSGFSIGISSGLRYDFSDKLYGIVRYTYQLNDHYTGPLTNFNYKIDITGVGIGIKF